MRISALLAVALAAAGCGGTAIGPDNQLEVTNATDNFQFQVTALDDVSETLTYSWAVTGSLASVDHSSSITGGTATLVIRDADGTQVYGRDLSEDGVFDTGSGTAGTWEIVVDLSGVTGAVNFRVQKQTLTTAGIGSLPGPAPVP